MFSLPLNFPVWSYRRQREEFRRSESQVWLLSQGPLRAVAAGRRHHQDPLQKGSQWLVERRGVRPGGVLSGQLCGGGLLWLLLTWLQRSCVDPLCVYTTICYILYCVWGLCDTWFPTIALTHVHECVRVRAREVLSRQVMWIKLLFKLIWLVQFLQTNLHKLSIVCDCWTSHFKTMGILLL